MDVDNLLRGQSYAELKESYVIFICKQDPFGKGLPVYTCAQKPYECGIFENRHFLQCRPRAAKCAYARVEHREASAHERG